MYSIRRVEYIVLIFLKVKPSYCASLTILMLDIFLYNAEMDILRRKVHANVRNIILKHMFITRSFMFITRSFIAGANLIKCVYVVINNVYYVISRNIMFNTNSQVTVVRYISYYIPSMLNLI